MEQLASFRGEDVAARAPVYLCGDISHGYADMNREIIHGNLQLFEIEIPYMVEFHFKNTDDHFESTFGFSAAERSRGIVDLEAVKTLIERNADKWPVEDVTGYLEIGGPKLGRDYSDPELKRQLSESLEALRKVFGSL
jgi:ribulose-phosphate 3-epimerase